MKICVLLLSALVVAIGQITQTSSGRNSSNIAGVQGDVTISEGGFTPHIIKNYGCNMWIMDYGPGYSEDDVFLNTGLNPGDGAMYYGKDAKQQALKVGDRFSEDPKIHCDHSGKSLPRPVK